MAKVLRGAIGSIATILLAASAVAAQENAGKGFAGLVGGNERFGRRLLQQVHSGVPERNVVVSPISLTLFFAALRSHAWAEPFRKEIDNVFGWGTSLPLSVPARQLLAAFEEPAKPKPCTRNSRLHLPPCSRYLPEGAWITNTFLYRSTANVNDPIAKNFVQDAKRNFGFQFVNTGLTPPTPLDLGRARKSINPLPDVSAQSSDSPDDIWISSGTHLQTAWAGNTFSMSKPYRGEFRTAAGQAKQVELLDSEMEAYLYAKTDTFEAVALPCNSGYMIAVLPAFRQDIHELERELTEHPESLDAALQRQPGIVTMPSFRIRFESDLGGPIRALGINDVFKDLGEGIVKIHNSRLTKVAQKIDLEVSQNGIRADAETVAGVVYGGIMAGRQPFQMSLNRPFVFLIRDETTNALLFLGAVMDPSQQFN